ncbi:hypothetical protein ACTMU2_14005 [Cupriavidus basilensis]
MLEFHMSSKYVELGAGFFLTDVDSFTFEICDANSSDPDVYYGPLAWNGGVGPASSRRLALVEPSQANAYLAAMMAYDRDEGEHPGDMPSWPATATVCAAGLEAGLGDLQGRQFDSEEALVKAVRPLDAVNAAENLVGVVKRCSAGVSQVRHGTNARQQSRVHQPVRKDPLTHEITMDGYFIKTIGANRGKPRVWLQGLELERAGFAPGQSYEVEVKGRSVVLTLSKDGTRTVTPKQVRSRTTPVIDLNSNQLLAAFDGMAAIRMVVKRRADLPATVGIRVEEAGTIAASQISLGERRAAAYRQPVARWRHHVPRDSCGPAKSGAQSKVGVCKRDPPRTA